MALRTGTSLLCGFRSLTEEVSEQLRRVGEEVAGTAGAAGRRLGGPPVAAAAATAHRAGGGGEVR